MRQSLMNSFDEIFILDMHGNSLKKEKAPDGSKDENVFDIQQGVAIAFFIKYKNGKKKQVNHHEIFGLREEKYKWLYKHDIKNVKWEKHAPHPEFYLFKPTDNKLANHYYSFYKITEIFPVNSVGVVTGRDDLTIGFTEDEIWDRVRNFARLEPELARQTYKLGEDSRDWKVEFAQKDIKESGLSKNHLTRISYRPFDIRYTYYTGKSSGFYMTPRNAIMHHLLEENIGLVTSRQTSSDFRHIFITSEITEYNLTGSAGKYGSGYLFPLYLYHEIIEKKKNPIVQMLMFEPEVKYQTPQPNVKPELFEELKKNYKKGITPEELFYYIYAVFYSNIYRKKYAEFLKIDFPRVPFTKNYKLFTQLGKLGKQLADLHLLKAKELDKTEINFSPKGSDKVEKPKYEDEKVWINKEQYFNNVPEKVWQYQVGGYQVCEKWLKDRKERTLTLEEIQTYCKIVTALSKTIELQNEIDKYYESVEKMV